MINFNCRGLSLSYWCSIMSSQKLSTLPLDGIRPILSLLDLESLVKLYATFDRSIQRLVSSSGAFNALTIKLTTNIPRAPLRYFLTAVRNVSDLTFADGTKWSAMTLPILTTLNPTSLSIGAAMMHPSVINLLEDFAKTPDDAFLRELAQNFTWCTLPNFERLTPRLTTLTLRDTALKIVGRFSFAEETVKSRSLLPAPLIVPDTLTSLNLDRVAQDTSFSNLYNMPSTLRSLSLGFAVRAPIGISILFALFPHLETLILSGASEFTLEHPETIVPARSESRILPLVRAEDFAFPATLNSLSLMNLATMPFNVLNSPALKASSISDFVIHFIGLRQDVSIDLGPYLPPSVMSLRIMQQDGTAAGTITKRATFISLPTSLTDLMITDETSDSPAFLQLPFLKSLQSLAIRLPAPLVRKAAIASAPEEPSTDQNTENGENGANAQAPKLLPYLIPLQHLSHTLTSLSLWEAGFPAFEAHHITSLPPNLKTLNVTDFSLALHPLLKERAPYCRLTFHKLVSLLQGSNGSYLREKFADALGLPTAFNASRFYAAVLAYYRPRLVSFALVAITSSDSPMHTVEELIAFGPKIVESRLSSTKLIKATDEKPLGERREPPIFSESASMLPFAMVKLVDQFHTIFPSLTKITLNLANVAPFPANFWKLKSLKHVELYDTPAILSFKDLPESLTHLSGNTSLEVLENTVEGMPHPNFKVLDFPYGTFSGRSLAACGLKDMDRFYCNVSDMVDRDVIPFLTTHVNAKTRHNMRLSIKYMVTGDLIARDQDDASLKHVTWGLLREKTDIALRKALDAPYIPQSEETGAQDVVHDEVKATGGGEKIGDVLESLKVLSRVTAAQPIIVPLVAESAILNSVSGNWNLALGPFATEDITSPAIQLYHAAVAKLDRKDAPCKVLTRLEVTGVISPSLFWKTLPNSLTDLRISTPNSMELFGKYLPNSLRILVLQCASGSDRTYSAGRMPFKLSALPATIEHFAILSPIQFVLRDHVEECKKPLNLPRLKTVRLTLPTAATVLALVKILPVDTMEKIYVQEIHKIVVTFAMVHPNGKNESAFQPLACEAIGARDYDHAFELASEHPKVVIAQAVASIPFEVDSEVNAAPALPSTSTPPSPGPSSSTTPLSPSSPGAAAAPVRKRAVRAPRK